MDERRYRSRAHNSNGTEARLGKKRASNSCPIKRTENYVAEVAGRALGGRLGRFSTRHRGATRLERVLERVLSAWYSREPVVRLCLRLTMSGMPQERNAHRAKATGQRTWVLRGSYVSIAPVPLPDDKYFTVRNQRDAAAPLRFVLEIFPPNRSKVTLKLRQFPRENRERAIRESEISNLYRLCGFDSSRVYRESG